MKIYLNLIFALLLTITIYTTYGQCGKLELDIRPVTSCSYPNGMVIALVNGDKSTYELEWEDLQTNSPIPTTFFKFAHSLKAGDYKVTATSKSNSRCKLVKQFFVPGNLKFNTQNCTSEILTLESIKIYQTIEGGLRWEETGNIGEAIIYRIIDPRYSKVWTTVPKPRSTGNDVEFKSSLNYEFATTSDFGPGNMPNISAPIKAEFIMENTNRLANNSLNSGISISPQPASDFINMKIGADLEISSLEILNLSGQVLMEQEVMNYENLRISVKDLESGLYFVKIQSNSGSLVKKVAIKR